MKIGKRLRELRLMREATIVRCAGDAEVPAQRWSDFEHGRRKLEQASVRTLCGLAAGLGIHPAALLFETDEDMVEWARLVTKRRETWGKRGHD